MSEVIEMQPTVIAQQEVMPENKPLAQKVAASDMIMSVENMQLLSNFAHSMAGGKVTVPKHLQGNVGDCMAITMQAMQWGMNPFVVAQKTHLVNGQLGYEAQLTMAILNTSSLIKGRLDFEYIGDWDLSIGKVGKKKNPQAEEGLGVIVKALFVGDEQPKDHKLFLSEVNVRNSPLWESNPKLQLTYLASKQFARKWAPELILGVYSEDEIEPKDGGFQNRVVNPRSGVAANDNSKVLDDFIKRIEDCSSNEELDKLGAEAANFNKLQKDRIRPFFKKKKDELSIDPNEQSPSNQATYAQVEDMLKNAQSADEVNHILQGTDHLPENQLADLKSIAVEKISQLAP